ncbi:HyaD/HybD family hydrogenase maturation endopeptidase [Thiomicrospira microaerophila]|uniref:HyaD/HybD family hydrogenase maturation endopeptidase n=1 Tax=Thiomicrospira microaerophila TaxID=406020 RepID=UPI00200CB02C|nr:HyaD/HybD family hydrogenase maturation endopeptidase [Thiomicrospira microaerophila]UQB42514.1 HyaD/HybD family hydrogenase maturation endopeptidase [Thiomicrospira microaerophila]
MDVCAPKIAVLGLGNLLFKDEGLGVVAMHYLRHNFRFSAALDFVDGGTLGINLLDYFHDYSHLLILDSLSTPSAEPGAVFRLPLTALQNLGDYRKTAHEIELLQALDMARLLGLNFELEVVAMIPQDIESVTFVLSEPVQAAMPLMADTAREVLANWGVQTHPIAQPLSAAKIAAHHHP